MKFLPAIHKLSKLIYSHYNKTRYPHISSSSLIARNVVVYNPNNLYMSENTNIDSGAIIMNPRAKFIIKRNSGAAIGLLVVDGNHMSLPGVWFKNVTDAIKDIIDTNHEYNKDIVINEDVWIGSKVTLLSGVHIGRGCIVGSGSVVRKAIPPYSVVLGNPAKIVGFKFTPEEIIEHEKVLYSEEERLSMDTLKYNYEKYYIKRIKEINELLK